MKQLMIDAVVQGDLYRHAEYYESKRPQLGLRFLKAVDRAFEFIQQFPRAGAIHRRNVRLVTLKKFPIAILYRIRRREIHVFATFHLRSNYPHSE